MRSLVSFFSVAMVFAMALSWVSSADAHDYLKEPLMKRYNLKSVSCSACHPGSNKAINNQFGMKFKAAFKGKDFTRRIKATKDIADKDAAKKEKDAIGEEMVAEFNNIIGEIEKTQMTIADFAKAGLLNGTKLQKETIAELGKAQGVK